MLKNGACLLIIPKCSCCRSLLLGFIHKKLQVLEDKDGRNGQAKDAQNELRVESSNVTFICDEFKKNSAVILNLGKSEKDYQKPVRVSIYCRTNWIFSDIFFFVVKLHYNFLQ